MRVDDYRFYGKLCQGFGIFLFAIGIVLPIMTGYRYYDAHLMRYGDYMMPYLKHGIALIVIGVILIVISQIMYREYRFRIEEIETKQPPSPTFCWLGQTLLQKPKRWNKAKIET